jgi:hypothetical protein
MTDVDVLPSDTSWLFEPTTGVHQFGGGSDETAKEQAKWLVDGHDVELWQLIASFSSNDPLCGLNGD